MGSSQQSTTNNPTGEPVLGVLPSHSIRASPPTRSRFTSRQSSGNPTKGAKLAGGNLPSGRLRAPTPTNQQITWRV
ncbi:MAG: hypothetical protein ACHBN1_33970 [Heteroscytonema crispum UTEX LB 1556]